MGLDPSISNRNRDHMANERTFLAWVRTSIGLMAFGFVIERFPLLLKHLFLSLEQGAYPHTATLSKQQGVSTWFGIFLLLLGAVICLLSLLKFKKHEKQIDTDTFQPSSILASSLTVLVVICALLLAIYLIFET